MRQYLNSTALVITLNVNDLNPIQRQIVNLVFFLKKKKNPITCCLKETYFNYKNIQIKDERIENTYHAKIT